MSTTLSPNWQTGAAFLNTLFSTPRIERALHHVGVFRSCSPALFPLAVAPMFPARMAREQSPAVVRITTSWHWQTSVEQAPAYGRIGWFVRRIHFRVRSRSTFCFHSKPQRSMAPFPCGFRIDRRVFFMGNGLRGSSLGPDSRPGRPARFDSEVLYPVCACSDRDRRANSVGLDSRSRYEIPGRNVYWGLYSRLSALSF